jgi:hypothetical protein
VSRQGPAHGTGDAVMFAFGAHHARSEDIPDPTDGINRLAELTHRLRWHAPHPAHGLDCVSDVDIGRVDAEFGGTWLNFKMNLQVKPASAFTMLDYRANF